MSALPAMRARRDLTDEAFDGEANPHARTPEARLLFAVLLQAVDDAPRQNRHGRSARAFLDDESVQALAEWLWDVCPSGSVDRQRAQAAIRDYRHAHGAHLQRKRQRRAGDAGRPMR